MKLFDCELTVTHKIYHIAGIRIKVKHKDYVSSPDRTFLERNLKENAKMELNGWWDGYRRKCINEYFRDEMFSWYLLKEKFNYHILKRLNIPQVEFVLTTNCTLKCKHCSNLIPQLKNKYMMSFEEFKSNVDALSKASHEIKTTLLLGGEPLLNKDLPAMVSYIAKNKKFKTVYIVTNATISLSQELKNAIKKSKGKVRVYLSDYSANQELKPKLKIEEIVKDLQNNGIAYFHFKDLKWRKMSAYKKLNMSENEIINRFLNCPSRCVQIYNAHMHICPISTFCEIKDLFHFDREGQEFLYLNPRLSKKDLRTNFLNFYKRSFFKACDYCPTWSSELIIPAEQL